MCIFLPGPQILYTGLCLLSVFKSSHKVIPFQIMQIVQCLHDLIFGAILREACSLHIG